MKRSLSKVLLIYKYWFIVGSPFFLILGWMCGERIYFSLANVHTKGKIIEIDSYNTRCGGGSSHKHHRPSYPCTVFHGTISLDSYESKKYGIPKYRVNHLYMLKGKDRQISETPYSTGVTVPVIVKEKNLNWSVISPDTGDVRVEKNLRTEIRNYFLAIVTLCFGPVLVWALVSFFVFIMGFIDYLKSMVRKWR